MTRPHYNCPAKDCVTLHCFDYAVAVVVMDVVVVDDDVVVGECG